MESTIKHHKTTLPHHPHISRFLSQLPHRSFLGAFTGVDETGGDFDYYFVDWWSVLFLEDYFGAYVLLVWKVGGIWKREGTGWLFENRNDAHAVDIRAFWSSASFSVLPGAGFAGGVGVRCSCNELAKGMTWDMGVYRISFAHFASASFWVVY